MPPDRSGDISSTCFISDLHLDPARPAVTRALAGFLSRHQHCAQLYILGDLFEAWPGDDDDSPLALETTRLLRDYGAAGPRVYIMRGNRDFLLGERFCSSAGATLLTEPAVIDLYGQNTLLMHGDTLCTADVDYQAFRRTARDPAWQARLLAQPLAERRAIAAHLRSQSQAASSMKSQDIMDVTPDAVASELAGHQVRQLIHGHTHRPARHDRPEGVRWVLGAWEEQAWFIEASSAGVELINFNIYQ